VQPPAGGPDRGRAHETDVGRVGQRVGERLHALGPENLLESITLVGRADLVDGDEQLGLAARAGTEVLRRHVERDALDPLLGLLLRILPIGRHGADHRDAEHGDAHQGAEPLESAHVPPPRC